MENNKYYTCTDKTTKSQVCIYVLGNGKHLKDVCWSILMIKFVILYTSINLHSYPKEMLMVQSAMFLHQLYSFRFALGKCRVMLLLFVVVFFFLTFQVHLM